MRAFLEARRLRSEFFTRFRALEAARDQFVRDFAALRSGFEARDLVEASLSAASERELVTVGDSTLFEHRAAARGAGDARPSGLTGIDVGRVVVTTRRIGFAGTRTSRSIEFRRALQLWVDGDRLMVAPTSQARPWQVRLPEDRSAEVAALTRLALASPDRRLDSVHGHDVPGHWFRVETEGWAEEAAMAIARGEQDLLDLRDAIEALIAAHPEVDFPAFQFEMSYEVDDDLRARIAAHRAR